MKGKIKNAKDIFQTVKNISLVVLGTFAIAFATSVFLVPFNLVAGGMTGLSIIIELLVPFEFVTVDLIITVLTWAFFLIGWVLLGRAFALKTLVSTLTYPTFVSLLMHLSEPDVLGGYFCFELSPHPELAFVLASIVGGALVGFGCAIAFLGGGSTGGIDVIALLVSKYIPKFKSSRVLLCIDTTVVILGVFIIRDIVTSLLGIVSALVSATVIEKVFLGGSQAFIAQIISSEQEEIRRRIIEDANRTATVVKVTGGYSGEEKTMLIVSFTMREYHDILKIISTTDKRAFVTVHRAHEINGEGWTWRDESKPNSH